MPIKARTYQVDLTLDQIIQLRDVLTSAHANENYYAAMNLADAQAAEDERWKVRTITESRAKQANLSDLHEALVGAPLPPAVEQDRKPVDVDA